MCFVKAKLLRSPELIGDRETYIALNGMILFPLPLKPPNSKSYLSHHLSDGFWGAKSDASRISRAVDFVRLLLENATTLARKDEIAKFVYFEMESARKQGVDEISVEYWDSIEEALSNAGFDKVKGSKTSVKRLLRKLRI